MAKFKKGDTVRQKMSAPIVGTVGGYSVDGETGDVQILVQWTDADGNMESTYFTEDQVEAAT